MDESIRIILTFVLILALVALLWLSPIFASCEIAIMRVSRSLLNNYILEQQTQTQTVLDNRKIIQRVARTQRLLAHREGTAAAATFFRVVSNVLAGMCLPLLVMLWVKDLLSLSNLMLLIAAIVFIFAIAYASLTAMFRRNMRHPSQALQIVLKTSWMMTLAYNITSLFHRRDHADRVSRHADRLSDEEELEQLHYEQGQAMIERLVETDNFDQEVGEMLRNIVRLPNTLTREIMVPRTDILCVEQHENLSTVLQMFSSSGFSRIPIIGDSVDDLLGIAYMKDAMKAVAFNPDAQVREVSTIARNPLFVPESKPVDDLFHEMQRTRQHIAIVIDEYGGVAGLVTIEDAIEQIVGELEDEHDKLQKSEPEKISDTTWRFPARASLSDVEEIFEIDIDEDDVDTLYGLLTKELGRVPTVGSIVESHGLQMTAVDSAGRRKKVSTIVVEPVHQMLQESVQSPNDTE